MKAVLVALFASLRASLRRRVALQLEILALRHQLAVYQRHHPRTRIQVADRLLWSWLSRAWAGWRSALVFVQPSTVIAWQRRRFRDHWASLSRRAPGRPAVAKDVRELIREMSRVNPSWGSPRIVGEFAKLGIQVAKATVEKYMVRLRKPPYAESSGSISSTTIAGAVIAHFHGLPDTPGRTDARVRTGRGDRRGRRPVSPLRATRRLTLREAALRNTKFFRGYVGRVRLQPDRAWPHDPRPCSPECPLTQLQQFGSEKGLNPRG